MNTHLTTRPFSSNTLQEFDEKKLKPMNHSLDVTPLDDDLNTGNKYLSSFQHNMRQVYNNHEKKLLLLGIVSLAVMQGAITFYPKWCTNRAGSKLSQIDPPKAGNENWYHQTALLSVMIDAITTLTWPFFKEVSSFLVNKVVYNNLEQHTPLGLDHTSASLRELDDALGAQEIQNIIPKMQDTINSVTQKWQASLIQANTTAGQAFAHQYLNLQDIEQCSQQLSKLPNPITINDISTKKYQASEADAQDIQNRVIELKLIIDSFNQEWSHTMGQVTTSSGQAFVREYAHLKNVNVFNEKLSLLSPKIDPQYIKTMKYKASQFAKMFLYKTTTAILSSPLMPLVSSPLFALRQNAHIDTCRNFSNYAVQSGTDSKSISWLYAGYPHLIYRKIFEVPSFFIAHFTLATLVNSLLLNPTLVKIPALKPHEQKIKFIANMPISAAAMILGGLAGWYPESMRIQASLASATDDNFWPTFWNSFTYNLPSLAMIGFFLGPIMHLSNSLVEALKVSKAPLQTADHSSEEPRPVDNLSHTIVIPEINPLASHVKQGV